MLGVILLLIGVVIYMIFRKVTSPKMESISGDALSLYLKDKSVKRQFIDVRTTGEFQSNKIKGFKNIPLQSLRQREKELKKDVPVVLICASGSRSLQAARILSKAGFENLINVKGGMIFYRR